MEPRLRNLILEAIQEGIPIVRRPFEELARKIGISEDDFVGGIKELKKEGIIRQISPIYHTPSLGYQSVLVGFSVEPEKIRDVASVVSSHPGVSHNYRRDHTWNLWFTLAVPEESRLGLNGTVEFFASCEGVREYVILRSRRLFKLKVKLVDDGKINAEETVSKLEWQPSLPPLNELEKRIVRVTQYDMFLTREPYASYAEALNLSQEKLISKLQEFKEQGRLRRVAAVLYHRKAGFQGNGMGVWIVPLERIEEVGKEMASFRRISHCYDREVLNDSTRWRYNLFTMIHGKNRDEVIETAQLLSERTGIREYDLLFSVEEYKKKRVQYFEAAFVEWEQRVIRKKEKFRGISLKR